MTKDKDNLEQEVKEQCNCECDCNCNENECDCENCECDSRCECDGNEEIEKITAELEKEKLSRLQLLADFVNYRKRAENEKSEAQIVANKILLNQIIDVVDDFDRAISLEADKISENNDFYKGMVIIRRKFTELLTNYGLTEIKAEVGGVFEAATMEAISTAPVNDKKQQNKIIHIAGKGYFNKENNKIFRPAKVIIGK